MEIPVVFLGSANEVRKAMRRLATKISRGASIAEVLQESPLTDTDAHPDALVWTNAIFSTRSAASVDFRLVLLRDAFFSDKRISLERAHEVRRDATTYLETTAWGTVVLNSNQGMWAGPVGKHAPPCRQSHLAIVRGTYKHWETIEGVGLRYCTGQGAVSFTRLTVSCFAGILESLGVEVGRRAAAPDPTSIFASTAGWSDPRPAIEKSAIIARLESDDAFWASFVEREYGPLPTRENLDRIAGICASGVWNAGYWELLQREGGTEVVEKVVGELREREKWQVLMNVFVHGLSDMKRAAALYDEHSDNPQIQWARERVAEYQAEQDPLAAAALLFEEAESGILLGKKMYYQRAADKLAKARDMLTEAGREDLWRERIDGYRTRHRRRSKLIDILDWRDL